MLPTLQAWQSRGNAVVASDDKGALFEDGARIGVPLRQSTIRLGERLVLERGAAWCAPIYYRADNGIFRASSALKPLVRDGDPIDVERLAINVVHAGLPNRSVFSKIRVLAPLSQIHVDHTGHCAVNAPIAPIREHDGTIDNLAEELRAVIFDAVRDATSGRKIAVSLSGGLDSSSVFAVLWALRGASASDIQVLTLDFDGLGNDREYVRMIEKHFGVAVSRIKPEEGRAFVQRSWVVDSAPTRHPFHPLQFALTRHARDRAVEFIVGGAGGDEFFGGDFVALTASLRRGDWRVVRTALKASFPHNPSLRNRSWSLLVGVLRPSLPRWFRRRRAMRQARDFPSWMGPVMQSARRAAAREAADTQIPMTATERYLRFARGLQHSFGAEEGARSRTATGVAFLDPFFDDRIVRLVCSIPVHRLFADMAHRGLLRRAMRGLLPEGVRKRVSKGRFEPAYRAMMWPLEGVEPLMRFARLEGLGVLYADSFRKHLAPLLDDPASDAAGYVWGHFWNALAAEAFLAERM